MDFADSYSEAASIADDLAVLAEKRGSSRRFGVYDQRPVPLYRTVYRYVVYEVGG